MSTVRRLAAVLTVVAALIAVFLSRQQQVKPRIPYTLGRKDTVLFLATTLNGLSNVHFATAFALLEHHPEISVHFASFSVRAAEVKRISDAGLVRNPAARPITWHELQGADFVDAVGGRYGSSVDLFMPAGPAAMGRLTQEVELLLSPWNASQHLELYTEIRGLVEDLDPAIAVIDTFLTPAMDYLRDSHRLHAVLSPNALVDVFAAKQPWGQMLWKFPAIQAGLPFPIPWRSIPANLYMQIRFIYALLTSSRLSNLRRDLSTKGIDRAYLELHRDDVPWLAGTFTEASIPLSVVPPNVTVCGAIALDVASAEEQDPELANWMAQSPTILVNLGSAVTYNEEMARAMVGAFVIVLEQTNAQVIWKFRKVDDFDDTFTEPVEKYIMSGRLRLESWLNVDPMSLLNTGNIAVSVHHGGANCYYETVLAGVPHVVLPVWADHYGFAATAEYLDIGIWPGKETAPDWEPQSLGQGILEVFQGEHAETMRAKAKALGEVARSYGGRDVAAAEIAKWAAKGS